MNEFENLKRSYIEAIHLGMACQTGYDETKNGNELLHKFCSILVDNSGYGEADKNRMKHELDIVKEVLGGEIECYYKSV